MNASKEEIRKMEEVDHFIAKRKNDVLLIEKGRGITFGDDGAPLIF